MAQADDVLLVSLSARGLRAKLQSLQEWCAVNFILINMLKTVILIFGRLLEPSPVFKLGNETLKIVNAEKYVGVNLRTDTQNIFEDHYNAKAGTARYCAHRIMAIEDKTGRLTPKELKTLYMARVDCHLTHGCEISPDCEDVHVHQLCDVQISFIRQILNLHGRSMLIPLYTETGIVPLRVRRFVLALGYLQYLLILLPTHFARAAVNSSIKLAAAGKKSWAKDLLTAASKLPFPCPELDLANATALSVLDYAKMIDGLMLRWIQGEVDSSEKLYLIKGRREPRKDMAPAPQTLRLRHYLFMVKTQKHREALTSLLLSTHLLAVEILRYGDHAQPRENDRSKRVCRFCKIEVETPEHALLTCDASPEVYTGILPETGVPERDRAV
ncbi:hypothetical protein B0H15DRAFT_994332 [Mycena belliarum]|uniref:Reverse transcriptase n=1 Tax=Mycena belliarum TaxID=1033014 RepID=A0AAD6TW72_9AGAR|nr:hypothetical protein B0H15DRAFT_994332 [Mycena belliae]